MKLDRLRDRFFEGAPRYRWLETIGRGGMGVVFKAQDLDLEDVVAIKVLSPDLEADEQELLTRFKREINLNRKIKHPNVARIHDFGTSGDYPYITMEFVPGKDLRTLIYSEGRLTPARAIAILRQIALGTEAAHKLGIIHRDLKSQNVMVEESGAVAILDFGLARGKLNENITLDSIMIGTPHYMSPEQALGRPTDARSDLYSIGVMAFEALTGKVPFTGEAPLVIAMKHVSEPVPEVALASVPRELSAIILKALAKQPEDRFPSAAELESELAALRLPVVPSGEVARPPSPAARPVPPRAAEPTAPPPAPRFTLAVPRTEPPAQAAAPPPAPEAPPQLAGAAASAPSSPLQMEPTPIGVKNRPPVVLIVGSDAVERKMVGGYIEQFGCKTLEARTGSEALETLFKHTVDVVLLDVDLSDMDGFDVTRVIKSQPILDALPVLLMSPRLDRNRFAFGIQSGATDCLSKPLVLESMITRVWDILQHRGFIPPAWSQLLSTTLRDALSSDTPISAARPRPS